MITVTPSASARLLEILAEENNPELKLRVFVEGGGCSGLQYGFTFDEVSSEDDFVMDFGGVPVLVDAMSSAYLQGATIDFRSDVSGENFVIDNPNATSTCGCGSSFSV
jgi:iron-sulfur cluster insertion protein